MFLPLNINTIHILIFKKMFVYLQQSIITHIVIYMKIFNKIINRIHKFFKDYPIWSIFCGILTFIFTLHWLIYAWFCKEAPNCVNYMEYDINFMFAITWGIICGLGSILFWIDVYKFFKKK